MSCASSGCHGSPSPVTNGAISQNEYTTWIENDKHTEAYEVLLSEDSRLIARNLNIEEAHEAGVCLDCHSYNVDQERRAATFDISEGVTCEACHGAASEWLGSHVVADGDRDSVGMFDSRDLVPRTELCLSCHLGDASKAVDHELIAAGHPDLRFELDTMTALMPSHWRTDEEEWLGARQWAVGQALALRESMRQLERRAEGSRRWPEFADFECFACHHNLSSGEGNPGREARAAGIPPWDSSRYVVFRQSLPVLAPGSTGELDRLVANLEAQLRSLQSRAQVAETARDIAETIEGLLPALSAFEYDAQTLGDIAARIASGGPAIGSAGIHSAEQAAMAIEALWTSYQRNTGETGGALGASIDELFNLLESTSRYDPDRFGRQLESVPVPVP